MLLWHGASAQPVGPCAVSDTATPPPFKETVSDSQVPVLGVGTYATVCPRAGTETELCTLTPVSVTALIVPETLRSPVFVRTTKPGASWPDAVVCPVQYQAEDSASGAPSMAAGVTGGPPAALLPGERAAKAKPTITAMTTTITTHRRCPAL